MPNITGTYAGGSGNNFGLGDDYSATQTTGAFYKQSIGNGATTAATSASYDRGNIAFNAAKSNSIYGASTTVQPPAVTVRYIIKY